MNPLLFADWGRMNRLFTRAMWLAVAVLLCVVCVALAAPTRNHVNPGAHPSAPAAAAAAASASGGGSRGDGSR